MPTMKHAGKAKRAGLRLVYWSLVLVVALLLAGVLARKLGELLGAVAVTLVGLWVVFVFFSVYFFRDPNPNVPSAAGAIVAPAHGKVDAIEETDEPTFLGGRCRRVSIFLSVFDVHVQNAPVAGRIALSRYTHGQFLNALRSDSATHNENLFLGIESAERPGEKVAVRLIAGLIARRIVPWTETGATVARGERIGLIQFGSRVDLYLPLDAQVVVALGARVKGGETVIAQRS